MSQAANTSRCEPSVICAWFQAMGWICSRTALLVTTMISYGCRPLEVGARRAASMMRSTLSCGTARVASIFLVA
ncbi:hypothetical protein D9M68_815990 [compost metagenome]